MQALRLDVEGDFNSFRIGYALQYQRTYLFPPKPTLIGLLGAALGLEDTQLAPLYKSVMVGIILRQHHGIARDLWGITKLKMAGEAEHAVVVREMLHQPIYWIYYAPSRASHSIKLKDLKAAFNNPVYPLSLGRSDELVIVKSSSVVNLQPAEEGVYYRYTVLPFDYRKRKYDLEGIDTSNNGSLELPQVFTLPLAYSYDKARRRSVVEYATFTHVFSTGVSLKGAKGGWRDDDRVFFPY